MFAKIKILKVYKCCIDNYNCNIFLKIIIKIKTLKKEIIKISYNRKIWINILCLEMSNLQILYYLGYLIQSQMKIKLI